MKDILYIPAIKLLSEPIPKWDYHIHTNYTDGKNSVREMVETAIQKNITRLIFTEHTEPWQAKQKDWFKKYVDDIQKCREYFKSEIDILIGIEAPAIDFDGNLEVTRDMLEVVDFVLGAAHRYPGIGNRKVRDLDPEHALNLEYRTLLSLCKSKNVDAIAHIGATCMKYCGPFPLDLTRDVIKMATEYGKAIEINQAYHKPIDDYLNICIQENAQIIMGSNAHDKKSIGSVYEAIVQWKNDNT